MLTATQEKVPGRWNTLAGHHLHESLQTEAISTLTLSQTSAQTGRWQETEESYLHLLLFYILALIFRQVDYGKKNKPQSITTDGSLASSSQPHTCTFHGPCCSCAFCLLPAQTKAAKTHKCEATHHRHHVFH